jgi:simple sugar transport system permease protein
LIAAVIVLFLVLSATAPYFLTTVNVLNVLMQLSFYAIIAWPMTLVIVAGEIDISVGSAVAFGGTLLAVLWYAHHWPLAVAIPAVLALGTVIGIAAGWVRAMLNIPSFIVTLSLFAALRGFALLLTNATPVPILDPGFNFLGNGRIADIPVPAIVMALLFGLFWFVGTRTVFGRWVYAVGGNPQAASVAGINVAAVRVSVFALTGLFAAVSAVLLAASFGGGDPNTSYGLEFSVIAGVIVGGTSLYGGRGSMVGTALGLLLIAMLQNGLVLLGVNQYAQGVVQGAVILLAVVATSFQNSLRSRGSAWQFLRNAPRRTASRLGIRAPDRVEYDDEGSRATSRTPTSTGQASGANLTVESVREGSERQILSTSHHEPKSDLQ